MKIPVEICPGRTVVANFDPKVLQLVSRSDSFVQQLTDTFQLDKRVSDVWRYTVKIKGGRAGYPLTTMNGKDLSKSEFDDLYGERAASKKAILLLLESPHNNEYEFENGCLVPKAPAQGRAGGGAGRAIREYLGLVLDKLEPKLADDEYALIVANPVPYHCSLGWLGASMLNSGRLAPKALSSAGGTCVRNHVWNVLWSLDFVRQDFLRRCRLYRAAVILNCCTDELRDAVTQFLCESGLGNALFTTKHPAVNWSVGYGKGGAGWPVVKVDCALIPFSCPTILDAVLRWCSLPCMFLLTAADRGQPDLHNLLLLLAGFECADPRRQAHEEWRQFEHWLGKRHPGIFEEGLTWFGEGLLHDCGGDHVRAAERLRACVEEYQSLPAEVLAARPDKPDAEVRPHSIVESVIHWCSTPYDSLVTVTDRGQPDLNNLKLLLEGFMTGDSRPHVGEEWHRFERWFGGRRPEFFREGLSWYGEGLLLECGNDHARAAERLKAHAEEYQRTLPSSRGQP